MKTGGFHRADALLAQVLAQLDCTAVPSARQLPKAQELEKVTWSPEEPREAAPICPKRGSWWKKNWKNWEWDDHPNYDVDIHV